MFKKELPDMSRITSFSKLKENMKKKKKKIWKTKANTDQIWPKYPAKKKWSHNYITCNSKIRLEKYPESILSIIVLAHDKMLYESNCSIQKCCIYFKKK